MTLIDLPDGRSLDIDVSGPEGGTPLVFHHGTPGSLVPSRGFQRAVHARGLRLVTYSRSGAGSSTRHPGRSVADVVPDVVAVLDHLGAERCFTVGKSGGGPHVLATAALLPDRVIAAASIAGVAPWGQPGLDWLAGQGQSNLDEWDAALAGEDVLRSWLEREAADMADLTVEAIVSTMDSLLPDVDRAVLTDEYGEDTVASFTEALRLGVDGWLDDDLAFTRPWGFDLASIAVPTFVWQGTADLMVPVQHGEWLAAQIPGAVGHIREGQGHLSITVGATDEILDDLLGCA